MSASEYLVGWLLEQIAEDERVSRLTGVIVGREYGGPIEGIVGRHAHTWTPARVLAECDTKRRLVDTHSPYHVTTCNDGLNWDYKRCNTCEHPDRELEPNESYWPCPTLKLLALPFADRPGYREEWKP